MTIIKSKLMSDCNAEKEGERDLEKIPRLILMMVFGVSYYFDRAGYL